jgi:hypothetical protein
LPTVRTNTIYLKAKDGKTVDFKQVTTFNTREKRFSIKLPEWWANILDISAVTGTTLDAVDLAWHKAGEQFEQLTQHKRKVIIYDFLSSAMMFRMKDGSLVVGHEPHKDEGDVEECILRTKGAGYAEDDGAMTFAEGTALSVWYGVAYEVTSDYEKYEIYVDEDGRRLCDNRMAHRPEQKVKAIDWSPQREGFFKQFELELTKLIVKMHFFLRSDTNKVAELIDRFKHVSALPDLSYPGSRGE